MPYFRQHNASRHFVQAESGSKEQLQRHERYDLLARPDRNPVIAGRPISRTLRSQATDSGRSGIRQREAFRQVVERVAEYTDFHSSFFEKPDTAEFNFGSMLFRSHSSITSEQRTEAFCRAQLLFEIWEDLATKVNELPLRLPSFKEEPPALADRSGRSWDCLPTLQFLTSSIWQKKTGSLCRLLQHPWTSGMHSPWAGVGGSIPSLATIIS